MMLKKQLKIAQNRPHAQGNKHQCSYCECSHRDPKESKNSATRGFPVSGMSIRSSRKTNSKRRQEREIFS